MSFAPLDQLPDIPTQLGADPTLLKDELLWVITDAINNHPRSQQVRIGPSEIGTTCTRCLARKVVGMRESGIQGTPWKPTVGTSVHSWLQDAFTDANSPDEPLRWLTEFRVSIGEVNGVDITGTCDLYDRVTATVVDFKIMGVTSLRKLKADGPSAAYEVQCHAYGRGYRRRQAPVERVALLGLPQNGELTDAVWWCADFDEQIVVDALDRCTTIAQLIERAGPAAVIEQMPADPDCFSCPRYYGATIPAAPVVAEPDPTEPGQV